MRTVRNGCFETNSSSTHSICMCLESDYDAWKDGDMMYDIYCEKLVPYDEDKKSDDKYRYQTFYDYEHDYELESYYEKMEIPSGETVVAFGKYGYA